MTESWVEHNMFCPICGNPMLEHYIANRPVADFFCPQCNADYELKSQERNCIAFNGIIPDGCYSTMIERITSLKNPNLFILTHYDQLVNNLIFIPNFFFIPEIIIKRPPLKETARRAGWVGCNIDIGKIPQNAKIFIIADGHISDPKKVHENYNRILSLKTDKLQSRGWLIDTMNCINKIQSEIFSLRELYSFENALKIKYPNNNFIKDKLRQQLQILRDKGFIEFVSPGNYKKITL